jgi:uncharacterized protein (TIGR03437 family)
VTINGSGSGPAAILNADGITVNGPTNPAEKGSTVSVFMTGEGVTTPASVTGRVTCFSGCTVAQLPVPLLPVAVQVAGITAAVPFFAEAPSFVAGVLQVNFTIPPNAPSGAVSLVVSIGGANSQANVTVQVQ